MKSPAVIVAVVMLAASTIAFAQPPRGPHGPEGMKQRHEQFKESLKLTDQQESQMKKFRLELERKQAQTRSKIQMARLDLKEIYLSDKLDRPAIEKTLRQLSDLQYQLKSNFVDFWFSVNGILTPEQQKTWKQHVGGMAGEARERIRKRFFREGPMMPGPPPDAGPR